MFAHPIAVYIIQNNVNKEDNIFAINGVYNIKNL